MGTINSVPGTTLSDTPPFPYYNDAVYLDDGNAQAWTVPADVAFVIIHPDGDIWARADGTAAVPGADVTDGTAGVRIAGGTSFQLRAAYGQTISFIREDASTTIVNISCWKR